MARFQLILCSRFPRQVASLFAVTLFLAIAAWAADEAPESLREKGYAALKAAQADPDQIIVAAKLLSQAADAFAKAGKDADAQELEAYLFWAKKKMTLQQIDAFLAKGDVVAKTVVARMEAVEKKEVKVEDSKDWLARADAYAESVKDPFLAAVRYFDVASRFEGTPEGKQAWEKSLNALQRAKVTQPAGAVVGTPERGEGKVYVQSDPPGASILVESNDGLRDTGNKTPAMVLLQKGSAKLVLRLAKFEDVRIGVLAGETITKTEVIKMELPRFDVDVTLSPELGDGWIVCVDGMAAMDKTGKAAVAPCTIHIAVGQHFIQLAKQGFVDLIPVGATVRAGENQPVKIRGNAVMGTSRLLTGVVVKATYGFGDKWVDATKFVAEKATKDGKFIFNDREMKAMLGDPVPFVHKQVTVEYWRGGRPIKVTLRENEVIEFR